MPSCGGRSTPDAREGGAGHAAPRGRATASSRHGVLAGARRWRRAPLNATRISAARSATPTIQPPLLAVAWERVAGGDAAFTREGLEAARRSRRWLIHERDPDEDGLITILLPDESGLDDSPKYDRVFGSLAHHGRANAQLVQRCRRPRSSAAAITRTNDEHVEDVLVNVAHALSLRSSRWASCPARAAGGARDPHQQACSSAAGTRARPLLRPRRSAERRVDRPGPRRAAGADGFFPREIRERRQIEHSRIVDRARLRVRRVDGGAGFVGFNADLTGAARRGQQRGCWTAALRSLGATMRRHALARGVADEADPQRPSARTTTRAPARATATTASAGRRSGSTCRPGFPSRRRG